MDDFLRTKANKLTINPKYYAQQCPVCNGFGTLRHGTKVCQGCDGRGYILVPTGTDGGKDGPKEA